MSDDAKQAVRLVYSAIHTDYGDKFTSRFIGEGGDRLTPKQWMLRLYSKVMSFPAQCIIDGYDAAARKSGAFPPTIPEIEEAIREKNRDRMRYEAAVVEAPKFSNLLEYVDNVLAPNARTPSAEAAMEAIKDILSRPDAKTKAERNVRLDAAVDLLNQTLADQAKAKKIRLGIDITRFEPCGRSGCDAPGVLSHSLTGGGPWYCKEHWRKTA